MSAKHICHLAVDPLSPVHSRVGGPLFPWLTGILKAMAYGLGFGIVGLMLAITYYGWWNQW